MLLHVTSTRYAIPHRLARRRDIFAQRMDAVGGLSRQLSTNDGDGYDPSSVTPLHNDNYQFSASHALLSQIRSSLEKPVVSKTIVFSANLGVTDDGYLSVIRHTL